MDSLKGLLDHIVSKKPGTDNDLVLVLGDWITLNAGVLDVKGSMHDLYDAADSLSRAAGEAEDEETYDEEDDE